MPVTYPATNPELCLPELDGKTAKMYRYVYAWSSAIFFPPLRSVYVHPPSSFLCSGGKICLSIHFMPLWAKNVPRFGIAHALALGVRLHAASPYPVAAVGLTTASCPVLSQLAPWMAAEVPHLIEEGIVTPT